MKIPWEITCSCGAKESTEIHITDQHLAWECPRCGASPAGELPENRGFSVGWELLARSDHEFKNERDYSMSIVFSAAAVDCELTRLYKKLRRDYCKKRRMRLTDQQLAKECRGLMSERKIRETTDRLYAGGLAGYLSTHPSIDKKIRTGFPSLNARNLPGSIKRSLYWKRNAILHDGLVSFDQEAALRCKNVAQLTLYVLRQMELA